MRIMPLALLRDKQNILLRFFLAGATLPSALTRAQMPLEALRPNCEGSLDFVNRWVNWGPGTRAGQCLLRAAKRHVLLQGRFSVSCADVREYALPVLRHHIFPTFTAASESVNTDQIVKKIIAAVKEPRY
jgi:MoxR-like ATPase